MPELRVRRDDIETCELAEGESPEAELEEGEVLFRIERFALSANNATYGQFGERLGYWRLFPAPEGWGRVPAWGYARAVRSRSDAAEEGRRVFGMVPMGSHVVLRPSAQPFGFAEAAEHRQELSPVYNRYLDAGDGGDDAELVMRPLFSTSVVLDLMLSEGAWDGSTTAILTSASSKTAFGLAHLLRRRSVPTIGLTSEGRQDWVSGLGLYDQVLPYDAAAELGVPGDAVLIDFAGDRELLRALWERLGDAVRRSVLVGFTHGADDGREDPLSGPGAEFFFAPDEIARHGRELAERYVEGWVGLAPIVERSMRVDRITDGDSLEARWRDLVAGRVDPALACVVALPDR